MKPLCLIVILCCFACATSKNSTSKGTGKQPNSPVAAYNPGPPILVYKTKADYNNLVPVILSDDKDSIVSYPDRIDLISGDGFMQPTVLHKGYLLDHKGITKNVAFLRLTYSEYVSLDKTPGTDELYGLIIDKDPLLELCNCGTRFASFSISRLDSLIDNNELRKKCKIEK